MSIYHDACSAAGYDTGAALLCNRPAAARLVDAVIGAVVRWYRFRRSLDMLRRLDGRTLQDLGFQHNQIEDVVLTAGRRTANHHATA